MKSSKLPALFFVVTAAYFSGMFLVLPTVQLVTKPLIVISLLLWYLIHTRSVFSPLKKWVVLALIFCVGGDTLLMFDAGNDLFFLLGLSSFLLGHVFFIVAFVRIKYENRIPFQWYFIVFPLVYFGGIMAVLIPEAGSLKTAITVYALVIVLMLIYALHLKGLRKGGKAIAAGAVFFVLSDSLLAVDKFAYPLNDYRWMVMVTYCTAVFLLTMGLGKYTIETHVRNTSHRR